MKAMAPSSYRSSSSLSTKPQKPVIIEDRYTSNGRERVRKYQKGKFLGKGGFAHCYELTDLQSGIKYAGKIVAKSSLAKSRARAKLCSEIAIHRSLHHPSVVKFEHYFEDSTNVYMIIELCPNKSLMDMVRRRKRLTEAETQYYMAQIIGGVRYCHKNNVIHRDLKLGNFFVAADMSAKIGDFGLAARLQHNGEKKKTMCGTPNYIAPEILNGGSNGHSYEVDIWSIGVVLYTMLIGRPPFETRDVKETYRNIRANHYSFPESVPISHAARSLIRQILHSDPARRPTLDAILNSEFMRQPMPKLLPKTALTSVPTAAQMGIDASSSKPTAAPNQYSSRQPLKDIVNTRNSGTEGITNALAGFNLHSDKASAKDDMAKMTRDSRRDRENRQESRPTTTTTAATTTTSSKLQTATTTSSSTKTSSNPTSTHQRSSATAASSVTRPASATTTNTNARIITDEDDHAQLQRAHNELQMSFAKLGLRGDGTSTKPLAEGTFNETKHYVTKWIDYSSKYGLGYQMSDGSVGAFFNDSSKIIVGNDGERLEYIERKRTPQGNYDERSYHTLSNYPPEMQKKITLVKHFKNYLAHKPDPVPVPSHITNTQSAENMPYVKKWLKAKQYLILRLSNKTVQVKFFDQTEIILSAEARLVTYINKQAEKNTYMLSNVLQNPSADLLKRLRYTKDILFQLLNNKK